MAVMDLARRVETNKQALAKASDRLLAMMPSTGVDKRQFMGICMALMASPTLADCTQHSLLLAAANCAKLGLLPDPQLGHAYVVPFNNRVKIGGNWGNERQATIIVGYRGYIDLARRSGLVGAVRANVVYENDTFDYEDGATVILKHKPWWMAKPRPSEGGRLVLAYCVAELPGGGPPMIRVVPDFEIEAARKRSKSADKATSPWNTDYEAMARKTAVRRAKDLWPLSPTLVSAVGLDDSADDERPQQPVHQDVADLFQGEDLPTGTSSVFHHRQDQQQDQGDVVDGQVMDQGEPAQVIPAPAVGNQPTPRRRATRKADQQQPAPAADPAPAAAVSEQPTDADLERQMEREREEWEQAEAERALGGQQQPAAGTGTVPTIPPLAEQVKGAGTATNAVAGDTSNAGAIMREAAATARKLAPGETIDRFSPIVPPVDPAKVVDWPTFVHAYDLVAKHRMVPAKKALEAIGKAKANARHLTTPNEQLPREFLNRVYRGACQGVFLWSTGGFKSEPTA